MNGIKSSPYNTSIKPPIEVMELVPQYLRNRRRDMKILNDALRSANFDLIKRIAHKVQGSAETYGFGFLGESAWKLETFATRQSISEIEGVIAEMESFLTKTEKTYLN